MNYVKMKLVLAVHDMEILEKRLLTAYRMSRLRPPDASREHAASTLALQAQYDGAVTEMAKWYRLYEIRQGREVNI